MSFRFRATDASISICRIKNCIVRLYNTVPSIIDITRLEIASPLTNPGLSYRIRIRPLR
jgi:hypothetical protein